MLGYANKSVHVLTKNFAYDEELIEGICNLHAGPRPRTYVQLTRHYLVSTLRHIGG